MRKTTGHVIRISGLVIEMLGIWGVYRASVNTDQPRIQVPGGTTISVAWIAVGLGFVALADRYDPRLRRAVTTNERLQKISASSHRDAQAFGKGLPTTAPGIPSLLYHIHHNTQTRHAVRFPVSHRRLASTASSTDV